MILKKTRRQFIGPGNTKIDVLGSFEAELNVGGSSRNQTMSVVNQFKALLSPDACVKLGLIACNCDIDSVSSTTNTDVFHTEFPKLFSF